MSSGEAQQRWYHGSQQKLTELQQGSSITQNRDIARVFSHRPSLVSQEADGTIKHDGTAPGYLYVVAEPLAAEDIYPHPHAVNVSRWEWLTKRPLRVQLVEETKVRDSERLTEEELAELRTKQMRAGQDSFAEPD